MKILGGQLTLSVDAPPASSLTAKLVVTARRGPEKSTVLRRPLPNVILTGGSEGEGSVHVPWHDVALYVPIAPSADEDDETGIGNGEHGDADDEATYAMVPGAAWRRRPRDNASSAPPLVPDSANDASHVLTIKVTYDTAGCGDHHKDHVVIHNVATCTHRFLCLFLCRHCLIVIEFASSPGQEGHGVVDPAISAVGRLPSGDGSICGGHRNWRFAIAWSTGGRTVAVTQGTTSLGT